MEDAVRKQYRTLLSLDQWVSRIVAALGEKKILENTIIIYIGDNSLAFGEHRVVLKTCGYEICNHIPLLIYYPYRLGKSINKPVSNTDIAPTIAELAGIGLANPDGLSLVGILKGQGIPARKGILIRWAGEEDTYITPAFWGIVNSKWRYMELVTGEKELYDMVSDPYELNNIANRPEYAQIQKQLANDLQELIRGER